MAWIVRESIAMEDSPKMNWDGKTLAWIHQAAAEVRASLAYLHAKPGVHQFFPVDLEMPDGTINQDYWCMRICHRVDAIALEHCKELYEWRPKPAQYPDWILYRGNEDNRFRLAIYKDRVAGMAMWYDWRMSRRFLSEELGNFVSIMAYEGTG